MLRKLSVAGPVAQGFAARQIIEASRARAASPRRQTITVRDAARERYRPSVAGVNFWRPSTDGGRIANPSPPDRRTD
jgi:hypothetical protein